MGIMIIMNGNTVYDGYGVMFPNADVRHKTLYAKYIAIAVTGTLGAVRRAGIPGPTLLVVTVLAAVGILLEALLIFFGVNWSLICSDAGQYYRGRARPL